MPSWAWQHLLLPRQSRPLFFSECPRLASRNLVRMRVTPPSQRAGSADGRAHGDFLFEASRFPQFLVDCLSIRFHVQGSFPVQSIQKAAFPFLGAGCCGSNSARAEGPAPGRRPLQQPGVCLA
jgi:hypothetical protein